MASSAASFEGSWAAIAGSDWSAMDGSGASGPVLGATAAVVTELTARIAGCAAADWPVND
jgi:hypothetical protein